MRQSLLSIMRRSRYSRQIVLTFLIVVGQVWPVMAGAAPANHRPATQIGIEREESLPPESDEGGGMTIVLGEGGEEQEQEGRRCPSRVVHLGAVLAPLQDDDPHERGADHARQKSDDDRTRGVDPGIDHGAPPSVPSAEDWP